MANAFYGKTLENVRNRQNIEIVDNEDRFLKCTAKPTIKGIKRFSEELCAIHLRRATTKFDKFPYIGFTILELSKLTMYKFAYNELVENYKDRVKFHL